MPPKNLVEYGEQNEAFPERTREEIKRSIENVQEILEIFRERKFFHDKVFSLFTQSARGIAFLGKMQLYSKFSERFLKKSPEVLKRDMLTLSALDKIGVFEKEYTPLVDLAAFRLQDVREGKIDLEALRVRGIKELVFMEDRDPQFFLNFQEYHPDARVPLARHVNKGEKEEQWTMRDLKSLVEQLNAQGIGTVIGFWGNRSNEKHNAFLSKNKDALRPGVSGSDDINPISLVCGEEGGEQIPFAEYVSSQYERIQKTFGFTGLFLGDGLMGYRSFLAPNYEEDYSFSQQAWTDFYKTIARSVHATGGKFSAYDVMGKSMDDAARRGVDYKELLNHLDALYIQTYGQVAWNSCMKLSGYSHERDMAAIASFHDPKYKLTSEQLSKLRITYEQGDEVEGWTGSPEVIARQKKDLAPHAAGALGVWSMQILAEAQKKN